MGKLISIAGLVVAALLFFGSSANAQSFVYSGVPAPGAAIGSWGFGHAANCQVQVVGSAVWYILVAQEGGYGYTNNASLAATVFEACQTGNLFAVHVTSLNPFTWDALILYPFK